MWGMNTLHIQYRPRRWRWSLWLLFAILVSGLLLSRQSAAYAALRTNEQPDINNPAARTATHFAAAIQADGATVSWQVPEAEGSWFYTVYRSTDCQWATAVAVSAPIFASTDSDSRTIVYSLTERFGNAATTAPVFATCNYWLVGADGTGAVQVYDSTTLAGVERLFLPQIIN